ncbi:hypothetical protein GCM10011611_61620 [Aliidongia dinghuensis]|uniref:Uncharacterized protein n=1 Tax=Aliidongia dinghuensis TaxID=1867774 RepID=A0A8J2Z0W6_9PROT|nr:hypothetical protein [Aliidongia dinghuensis]GGF46878.1 hypothetical protein GCM10011611_61620 [Aliidongia dinghuensis]
MRASILILSLSVLMAGATPFTAARADDNDSTAVEQARRDGRAVGQGTRDTAIEVGNGVESTANKVGHGVRDTAIEVGHGVENAAHAVGAGFESAWNSLVGKDDKAK